MSIRHIVIVQFWKKFDKDFVGLMESVKPIVMEIQGIVEYSIFANESEYVPKDMVSVGVEIIFKNEEALQVFMKHPKHFEANAIFEKYLAGPVSFMVLTHKI